MMFKSRRRSWLFWWPSSFKWIVAFPWLAWRNRNETEHLLASPENARRLWAAVREAEAGEGLRVSSVDDLRERLGASKR
jgi:hypothetical protein